MSMWTGMGPDKPAPKMDPNCQCICHTQPGVMHVAACCLPSAALAASPEVQALIETTLAALQDPLVVHLNMVAGKIAKPLPSQLVHIYGEDVIRSAFAALIREAEARVWEQVRLRDQRIRELEARDGIILLRKKPYGGASGGGTGC